MQNDFLLSKGIHGLTVSTSGTLIIIQTFAKKLMIFCCGTIPKCNLKAFPKGILEHVDV